MHRLRARFSAFYALAFQLPYSLLERAVREKSRALRGVATRPRPTTELPQVWWSRVISQSWPLLVETAQANGNVRESELAVLAQAAAGVSPGLEMIEVGTFDGRTTLNLAINAPVGTTVFTLDLPPEHPTRFEIEDSERCFVDKAAPGARYRECRAPWRESAGRIVQLLGDSATFDWSPHAGRAGLVFVDGAHAYDYARKDSETAFQLVAPGGMVLWHDYGAWEGVTRALEEIDAKQGAGLVHIRGTSLVFWRAPARGADAARPCLVSGVT